MYQKFLKRLKTPLEYDLLWNSEISNLAKLNLVVLNRSQSVNRDARLQEVEV